MRQVSFCVLGVAALAGCAAQLPDLAPPAGISVLQSANIQVAEDGRCYTSFVAAAATFETVTVQELIVPPVTDATGAITTPGVYRDVTRQQQAAPAQQGRFESPCPPVFTPDFNASLQRALMVRGLYAGPISGTYDQTTGDAVRAYQSTGGPDSTILSIAAGRRLGLVPLTQAQLDALDIP